MISRAPAPHLTSSYRDFHFPFASPDPTRLPTIAAQFGCETSTMTELTKTYSPSLVALCLVLIYFVGSLVHRVWYNLYQHPLAHIPGPKLAAATYLYQTFYGLAGGKSRYYVRVSELHKQYGRLRTPGDNECRF